MTAIERAYQMARSGNYLGFTQIKKALCHEFAVDRELQGKHLQTEITRICRAARETRPHAVGQAQQTA
jgi:hypothetical protein